MTASVGTTTWIGRGQRGRPCIHVGAATTCPSEAARDQGRVSRIGRHGEVEGVRDEGEDSSNMKSLCSEDRLRVVSFGGRDAALMMWTQ
jgi:hypothetical protein